MGLFGKKKEKPEEKPSERNVIDNHDIKVNLANTALGLLAQGEDYEELANTQVTFGYIFEIDGHGLEALYKITTDKTVAYFAAQGDKLMRLTINEDMFDSVVEGFLSAHKGRK